MDVKQAIAAGVQQMIVNGPPLDRSEPVEELEGRGYSIEGSAVDTLNSMIRVKGKKGIRYFTVKVTENI